MFASLSERLTNTIQKLMGFGRLTEDNIKDSLHEVRTALLEADVALPVVKQFISDTQSKAIGQEVIKSLKPGEALIKIVSDELVSLMGQANEELNLSTQPPAVILMVGLQGSGKTTTTAKLARWLKEDQKKSVMVTSIDIYRPAAIEQLTALAKQIDVHHYPSDTHQDPIKIAEAAIEMAKKQFVDVILIDTAGRLHIDKDMMAEIQHLQQATQPIETLFVVDSMTGQDAANTAKAFHDAVNITGIVLTKTDGDARGGAALSIRYITGKPIKFIGVGEKIDALEPFHPERIASRILGMGDIVSLVEEAKKKVDQKKAEKLAKKFKKGKAFDLDDFLTQLQQMKKMGGISNLLSKIPGMAQLPKAMKGSVDESMFVRMEAMINSMTPQERHFPAIIKGSRKCRIAAGSGTEVQDVNKLLKQFAQMQKMMKKFKGANMAKMMEKMKSLQHMFPPGSNLPF